MIQIVWHVLLLAHHRILTEEEVLLRLLLLLYYVLDVMEMGGRPRNRQAIEMEALLLPLSISNNKLLFPRLARAFLPLMVYLRPLGG